MAIQKPQKSKLCTYGLGLIENTYKKCSRERTLSFPSYA